MGCMGKQINKILVIYKTSLYQKLGLKGRRPRFSTKRLVLAHKEHQKSLTLIRGELSKFKIPYKMVSRMRIGSLKGYDLVVTVGGDGTFFRASHQVDDQLMLGVNSSPSTSVGALCSITAKKFPKKIKSILRGKFHVSQLNRMQVIVNQRRIKVLAMNDVLLANNHPAGTSRYVIQVKRKREEQRSSGVWIATASGSTAAILAAGGKVLPALSKKIQFLVREPLGGKKTPYRCIKGILKPGAKIKLVNKRTDLSLFIDGLQAIYPLSYRDQVVICNAKKTLRVIS